MTDEQILRSAFAKAKRNGWDSNGYEYIVLSHDPDALPPSVIFSHDFARAFWGEDEHNRFFDPITTECQTCHAVTESYYDRYGDDRFRTDYCWQHHLQQMVLEENRLQYIKRFLETTK